MKKNTHIAIMAALTTAITLMADVTPEDPPEEPEDGCDGEEGCGKKPEKHLRDAPAGIRTRAFDGAIVRELPPGFTRTVEGSLVVIASEAVEDRYKDIVVQNWKLDNYLRNPVILANHDRYCAPPAKCVQVAVVAGKLMAEIVFDENDPEAMLYKSKYDNGFMSSVSVGFRSLLVTPRSRLGEQDALRAPEGYILDDNELLEISLVTIPALPSAVAQRSLLEQVRDAVARDAGFVNELEALLPAPPEASATPAVEPEPPVSLAAWLGKE